MTTEPHDPIRILANFIDLTYGYAVDTVKLIEMNSVILRKAGVKAKKEEQE